MQDAQTLLAAPPDAALTMISMETGQTNDCGMALPSRLCTLNCGAGQEGQRQRERTA